MPQANISSFTEEQKRLFKQAAALGSGVQIVDDGAPSTIGTQNLASVPALTLPPTPALPRVPSATADASLESLLAAFNTPSQEERTQSDLQSRILASLETLGGQRARQTTLETQAGLSGQRQELQGVINQLQALAKERAAIPLQQELEGIGRREVGAVQALTDKALRENTIRALGLSAIGQTLQGNIALAESTIQSALDAEFEPERQKLQTLQTLYQFNKDALERIDKQKADTMNIVLRERERLLEIEEVNKKEIYQIGRLAQENGAPLALVQQVFSATTREEALLAVGTYLQSPTAKIALENARLDTLIKTQTLRRLTLENALIGQPSAKELAEQTERMLNAKTSALQAQDQIGQLNTLIGTASTPSQHAGLNSRVGTGMLSRAPESFWNALGRIGASTITGAITGAAVGAPTGFGAIPSSVIGALTGLVAGVGTSLQGLPDAWSGAGQSFAGTVHMITSQLTLDKLIQSKAAGATFGALSDSERVELANAASKIRDWEIKDKKNNGTGFWNIDERSFVIELARIRDLTQRALQRSGQAILSPDVEAILSGLQSVQNNALIDGARFY